MTRFDEQELQSVADQNPPAVEALRKKKIKLSVAEVRYEIKHPSVEHTPISYALRETIAHVPKGCTTPIAYFKLYITTAHCRMIAKHINIQAVDEIIKKPSLERARSRLWTTIDGDHISRFMEIILAMGLMKLPATEHYWYTATDVGRNIEISNVCIVH